MVKQQGNKHFNIGNWNRNSKQSTKLSSTNTEKIQKSSAIHGQTYEQK